MIDRVEDGGWLVLDVSQHPSLPVPLRIAPALGEGDAVTVTVEHDARGGWTVTAIDHSSLRLADLHGSFGWPASLAPAARRGDRLRFELAPDRRRGEALAEDVRALRERLTKR